MSKNILLSDANPPTSFTTSNNDRQWTFVESLDSKNNLLDKLDYVKCNYNCRHLDPQILRRRRTVRSVTFHCRTGKHSKCEFQLKTQKSNGTDLYHLYTSGQHTCLYAEKTGLLIQKGSLWPDELKPEESFNSANGLTWTLLETAKDADEFIVIRKDKFHCMCNRTKIFDQNCITTACMYKMRDGCAFKLFAQKTDRGRFHLFGSGTHTCDYEKYEQFKIVQLPVTNPPASIATSDSQKWTFLETIEIEMGEQLVKNLRPIGQKYNCICSNVKPLRGRSTFQRIQMYCTSRGGATLCAFRLLLQYTDRVGCFHLYASGKHTCIHRNVVTPTTTIAEVKDEKEEINEENRISSNEEEAEKSAANWLQIGSDGKPPPTFSRMKRHYNYLKTVDCMQELNKLRIEHQCIRHYFDKQPKCEYSRLHCVKLEKPTRCPFGLLCWRPTSKSATIHVYIQNVPHNHVVKPTEQRAMHRIPHKKLLSDAHPPASFSTPNIREWTFLETVETLAELDKIRKKKYHCIFGTVKGLYKGKYKQTMYCSLGREQRENGKCRFALVAQKTDRGRFHLYGSGKHTGQQSCIYKGIQIGETVLPTELLSDERPLTSFTTSNGREWTFLETLTMEEKFTDQLDSFNRKYHCSKSKKYAAMKKEDWRHSVSRMTFECATFNGQRRTGLCPFAVLVQKTDRGRLHVFVSRKHTCLYRKRNVNRKCEKEEESDEDDEDEHDEEKEKEEEMDVENMKEDGSDEEEEIQNEQMGFEEHDHKVENDEDDLQDAEQEECFEEKNFDTDEDQIFPFANALRSRSPTLPHEINDVQFLDFVDHPKSEGVKLHRLGEPKNEPGADSVTIRLEEEEPAMKAPKLEIKEEASAEEEPGPSNRGSQQIQQKANGIIAPPMVPINRQNQQPAAMARVRWWAEPVENARAEALNQKRLLRERKCPINYRE